MNEKETKVIMIVLVLIIIGLGTFIIMDKIINRKSNSKDESKLTTNTELKENEVNEKNEEETNKTKYSKEELEKMALDYYEAQSGYRPTSVGSEINEDGTLSIQLYDNMGDHNSTSDWYTIDMNTGKGTNIMNESIDLTNINKKESKKENVTNKNENASANQSEVEAIRKALKDDEWIKENVMMKNSAFVGVGIEHEQELTFMRVMGKNKTPIVVVEAVSEEDLSYQLFIVSYQNGKVVSKPLTENASHYGHSGVSVDPNKAVATIGYMHMGVVENQFFDISDGTSKFIKSYGYYDEYNEQGEYTDRTIYYKKYKIGEDEDNITEDEYKKLVKEESNNYNFYLIETELNDANVNEYIK